MDLILRQAAIAGDEHGPRRDIGIEGGRIAAIEPALEGAARVVDAAGRLVSPGFVESHIHLDKSFIFDRSRLADGSLDEAFRDVVRQKSTGFSPEDVRARAVRTLERCIANGTMHMRTQLEVDPFVGLRSLEGILPLIDEYRWAIDIEICVFPEEGLFNQPGTAELMVEALRRGCRVIGANPEADSTLSTNNVVNPITPFGHCSLPHVANLYAIVSHVWRPEDLAECFEMVTRRSARVLGRDDYGVAVGNPADLVLLDRATRIEAVCQPAPPLLGVKRGHVVFEREPVSLQRP